MKALGVLAVLLAGLVGGGGYFAFYSDVPLKFVAQKLSENGTEIQGMNGNLMSGFGFTSLKRLDDQMLVSITNGRLKYASLWELATSKKFTIEEIGADKVSIKLLKLGASAPSAPKEAASGDSKEWTARARKGAGELIREFRVNSVRFTNVEIKGPGMKEPFTASEFKASRLLISGDKSSLDELSLTSSWLDFKAEGVKREGGNFTLGEKVGGVFKAGEGSFVRKDLAFTVKAELVSKLFSLDIAALEDRFRLMLNPDMSVKGELRGFTPQDQFATTLPLRDLDLSLLMVGPQVVQNTIALMKQPKGTGIATPLLTMLVACVSGNLKVGETLFQITPPLPTAEDRVEGAANQAQAIQGGLRYTIAYKPRAVVTTPGVPEPNPPAAEWVIRVASATPASGAPRSRSAREVVPSTPRDAFAMLYFKRPYDKVSAADRARVDQDSSLFASSFGPSAPGVAPVSVAPAALAQSVSPAAQAVPANRAPASLPPVTHAPAPGAAPAAAKR